MKADCLVDAPEGKSADASADSGRWGSLGPVVVAALTALCLGYDAGVMSGAIGPIRRDFGLSASQEGAAVGCINLVAAFGALAGGKAADWRGRVPALGTTAGILLAGPVIIAASNGFALLFVGRVVTGIGVGLAFVVAPLYAAEVAPADLRGSIVSFVEILINGGVLLGYLSSILLPYGGWRLVTGLAAVPALLCGFYTPWLPESPRWLVREQRMADAEAALRQLGVEQAAAEKELRAVEAAVAQETVVSQAGWAEVLCPSVVVRGMLAAGLGCAFFQQISGSEVIVYYTPRILEHLGITRHSSQNLGAIAVGVAKFVGACLGALFLDLVGRRAGVITSCAGVFLCLLGLALTSHMVVGLVLLCSFMVFFELGLAPAAFVLGTECYPVAIRAKALALGMFTTRFLSGLVAVLFPSILELISLTTCLWAFCVAAGGGVLWAVFCVPETMGLTLEQTVRLFEGPSAAAASRPAAGAAEPLPDYGATAPAAGRSNAA